MATDVKNPDFSTTRELVERAFEGWILDTLTEYIRIPNESPGLDPEWQAQGYMDSDRIGTLSLVVCLDSGCGNYDQLWCTTSLHGLQCAGV